MLSESHRVQIWKETKQDLATDWAVLQHLLVCQNLHICSSRGRAEEETRESCKVHKQMHTNKETNWFLCLVLFPVSTSQDPVRACWQGERAKSLSLLNEYTVSCCWPMSVQNRQVCVCNPHRDHLTPPVFSCSQAFYPGIARRLVSEALMSVWSVGWLFWVETHTHYTCEDTNSIYHN